MSARLMRSGVAPMTGALKIVDGSVGSPAIKFNTDGTTGIYKTTDGIGVSVGGALVVEFTSSGLSRIIGELIPWTLLTAPSGWVLPYGQTLSRTTYADLWAIAQTEIAGGNTFYNNGDGTTTFGIGDLRGRVVAAKDNMGGTSAARLTPSSSGGVTDSTILGSSGGGKSQTLLTANLPAYTPTGSVSTVTGGTIPLQGSAAGAPVGTAAYFGKNDTAPSTLTITATSASTFTGDAQGGSSAAFNLVQPTIICNYILYVGA